MFPRRCLLLGVTAAALLGVSCSRGSQPAAGQPPPDQPPPAALTASCTPTAVTAGDPAGAVCTAALQHSTAEVSWTLSGPGALSAATGASVTYLPPAQLAAGATAHVVAGAAGLTAAFDLQVLPSLPPGVTGHAVDALGAPVAGLTALVAGHPAATTDDAGAFTIADVTTPYDLVLHGSDVPPTIHVYAGLTRRDPTVVVYRAPPSGGGAAERSAKVQGTVTGGDPDARTRGDYQGVMVASAALPATEPPTAAVAAIKPPESSYALSPSWSGAATLPGAVLAVQMTLDQASGAPTAYWMATAPDVPLTDGEPTEVAPLALAAAATVNSHGAVQLAPGQVLTRLSAQLAPARTGPAFPLFYDENGGAPWGDAPAFTYVLPVPDAGVLQLCARAGNTSSSRPDDVALACVDATGLTTVTIAVPGAPQPFAPTSGADAVGMDSVFAWQPFAGGGGVHVLEVTPDGPDAPRYLVVTSASRVVLPTLDDPALALPSGAAYSWTVRGFAPVAGVDAFTAPGDVPTPLDFPAPVGPGSAWGRSAAFHFTAR